MEWCASSCQDGNHWIDIDSEGTLDAYLLITAGQVCLRSKGKAAKPSLKGATATEGEVGAEERARRWISRFVGQFSGNPGVSAFRMVVIHSNY
jgi:hypothetical protein